MLIDGGACRIGVESTVVSVTGEKPVLLRPGAISIDDMEAAAETVFIRGTILPDANDLQSPGMMAAHYQTVTPLNITDDFLPFADRADVGFLIFGNSEAHLAGHVRNLSPSGNLREAAVNLYKAMRELDELGIDKIVARLLPEEGLGHANMVHCRPMRLSILNYWNSDPNWCKK